MYSDVVHLKLQKPATEPDEGVPLTTLGKNHDIFSFLSKRLFFVQVVEHVLILINNKIISSLLELKKDKFINVPNRIIINFWILSMHIIWLCIPFVGIHFIRKSSSVVRLIGR